MSEKSYWNSRYSSGGNSGYGSYGDQLAKKLDWICPLDFDSITEMGCGDFNFGAHILLRHDATYTGMDISDVVVKTNNECFPHKFISSVEEIPPADLLMCVDVLFHILDDKDYEEMLNRLEQAWTKYLVITAYERDQKDGLSPHVRIRRFDYKRFGEPIVREQIEKDGDLKFYIFKK